MVAISTLFALSTVVSGAAVNAEIEARNPQFGDLSGFFSSLGAGFAGFSLPAFALPTLPGATTTTAAVTTSSSKTTATSTTKATTSTTPVVSSSSSVKSAPATSTAKSGTSSTAAAVSSSSSKAAASSASSSKAAASSASSSKAAASSASPSKSTAAGTSSKASVTPSASGSSCPRPPRSSRSLKPSGSGVSSKAAVASSKASGSSASLSSKAATSSKASGSAAASGSTGAVSKIAVSSSAAVTASVSASCLPKPSSSSKSRRRPNPGHTIGHCSAGPCASSGTAVSKSAASSGSAVSRSAASSIVASASTALTSSTQTVITSQSQTPISTSVSGPSATISNGVVVGSALPNGLNQYLGIPYAQPPVGNLRLKPPVALTSNLGTFSANTPPASCPQLAMNLTGNFPAGGLQPLINEFVFTPTVQQEDCLTLSIWAPNNTTPQSNLPVVFWIYGGGFEFGATAMYNGSNFVARSVSLGAPVIFVEVNYRLGGFGFLAGADLAGEVSTNLGLRDQRLGLQWVADNIKSFGGDPTKVTLWGESAGAISSCYQSTLFGGNNTYKGQALFRGSIHNSGCFAPADNTTAKQAQAIYDTVVTNAGCSASTAAERLSCLRSIPFDRLHNATNSVPAFGSYRSADLSYLPRPDAGDNFYVQSAEIAIASGLWTKTPFIIGDQEDEGTLFAIVLDNITTSNQFVDYLATWFPNNPNAKADTQGLVDLYSNDTAAGSPFNTGSNNEVFPGFKRYSAILGDIVFTITRRAFLNLATGQGVKAWSYLNTYLTSLPTYGTLHGSDLAYNFDNLFKDVPPTVQEQGYYISFINYLDPNVLKTTNPTAWPGYNSTLPLLVNFNGGDITFLNDTFRQPVYDYLLPHVFSFRV